MKKLLLVLLVSSLTACSSGGNFASDSVRTWKTQSIDIAEITTKLRGQQYTAIELKDIQYQGVSVDSNNNIDISVNSPVVNFPEGESFTGALILPKNMTSFTFYLESIASRSVFVPTVIFLNENLEQIDIIDDYVLEKRGFFSLEKKMDTKVSKNARYVLIYTKDNELDGRTELFDIAREYEESRGKELSEFTYPRRYAEHSPIGTLNVQLKNVFFNTGFVAQNVTPVATESKMPTSTEAAILQKISDEVTQDNIAGAIKLVEEAEKAGSTKAQAHFMDALKKHQQ